MVRRVLLLLLAASVLLAPGSADAIPSFARKYATACNSCHAGAFPELNAWGRRFKENGYQLPAGAEENYRDDVSGPGGGERLTLLRELPLSARARSTAIVPASPHNTGENPLDLRMLESLYLMAGAAVAPNISFFVSATLAPSPAVHHGAVGFHNLLLGEGHLNVRFGRLLLMDFVRPEHRSLTRFGYPGPTLQVGLNPTALDSTQHGVDVYGRLWGRRIFYQAAVVQGAQGEDGLRDLDAFKDLFGQLQLTLADRAMLGVLTFRGKTQIISEVNGLRVRFTDRFRVTGVTGEAWAGPFTIFAQALYGFHDNPSGNDIHVNYWALRGQIDAYLAQRWVAIARYDQLISHHETEWRQATVHVSYLLLSNLKVSFESTAPLSGIDNTALSLRLDLAI